MRELDIVVRGGRIVDGSGNPWFCGDLGIRRERILAVAAPGTLRGRSVIDADGRYVTPGFVDPHTHSDLSILQYPDAESAVRQGVTTHVTGNCGMSPAPLTAAHRHEAAHVWTHYWDAPDVEWSWRSFREYLAALDRAGQAINIAPLVGHGAVRIAVMGLAARAATERELGRMERLVAAAMRAGAHGLSSGLVYPPGCYADTNELVRLCRVVAANHGLYASHIRGERETILAAVDEAITIGRRAGLPVEVSHNAPKWGAAADASANLALMQAARRDGIDVTTDNDVHTDLAPRLSRALPQPLLGLERGALLEQLQNPQRRSAVRDAILADELPGAGYSGLVRHGRFDRVVILSAPRHPQWRGRTVAQIAGARGRGGLDTFLDLIVEEEDEVVGLFDYIRESDILALLRSPLAMISSDGLVMPPAETLTDRSLYWPCSYGEYPGILERHVRGEGTLRLEDAIRKMTSFPAQRFGLSDRGILRPGLKADLVVFDLSAVKDRATNLPPHRFPFDNVPHAAPEGFDWVIVNGAPVIAAGAQTGARPGRVLRRR